MGAGAGIGGTVGARFAAGGYHAVLCRRSNEEGLERLVSGIRADGNEATGYLLNAVAENVVEERIAQVQAEIGPVDVVIYNLGAQIGNRTLAETSQKAFKTGWRMATLGLFRVARAVTPAMVERGNGTIIVTSATAGVRGNSGQHSHASAMGGRRMLCQSLNAEFASRGIHVAHVLVDGLVDAPDTAGKMLGADRFQRLRETRGAVDGLILPKHVAEIYWQLAHQHRSTWTFEMDIRSFSDKAWWND